MKGATTASVSAAELVHDPGRIMDLAANRPVRVVRDEGDELLVLGVESDLKVGQVGIEAAIAVMAAWLGPSAQAVADRFLAEFPWMVELNQHDREACVTELVSAARSGASSLDFKSLALAVDAWSDSADPGLRARSGRSLHWFASE